MSSKPSAFNARLFSYLLSRKNTTKHLDRSKNTTHFATHPLRLSESGRRRDPSVGHIMHSGSEEQAAMAAGIGASIVAARAVGRPDPSDTELYFDLQLEGFPGTPEMGRFQQAKAAALAALEMGIDALALILFVASVLMWAYGIGGAA